jgi:hypothetical protein
LDASFGTGGVTTISFGQTDAVAALLLQTDGKILAVGNCRNASSGEDAFAVARFWAH